jgi:hypothetical protein
MLNVHLRKRIFVTLADHQEFEVMAKIEKKLELEFDLTV